MINCISSVISSRQYLLAKLLLAAVIRPCAVCARVYMDRRSLQLTSVILHVTLAGLFGRRMVQTLFVGLPMK